MLPNHKDLVLPGIQLHLITSAAERIQQQANAEIRQQMMCNLRGKLNDESHMRSKIHLQKVVEQAQLDVALGPVIPFALRSLTPMTIKGLRCGPNAKGLTQERILAHWGSKVQSLCQFALDRFKGIGKIQLLKKVVDWNENFKASLFFVSYSGQGKYGDRSVAIPWSMLPENDEKNPNDWQIDLPAEASGESSWWPTIHVWLPGDHNSTNEYHWIETAGGTILVVVCVYQWLWPMPQGWSVRLANWSRL